jgi:hypothetical protein
MPELGGDIIGERDSSGVITLVNQQGWEFRHLSISNGTPGREVGYRSGILVFADKPGTWRHFVIADCHFHDIYGALSFMPQKGAGRFIGKHNGAVMFLISQGKGEVRLADLAIENNDFRMVARQAISTRSVPTFTYGEKAFLTDPEGRFENVVVRYNHILRSAADAVIISNPVGTLIEHNVVGESGVGWDRYDVLRKDGTGTLHADRGPYVGLWAYNGTGIVIQYNEVYGTYDHQDGTAFDADRNSYGTVIQYNYSHDNNGGFFATFGSATDTLIRYNVSINDHRRLLDFGFLETHDRRGIRTEHNLFVTPTGAENITAIWGANQNAPTFDHNIVIVRGGFTWVTPTGNPATKGPKKIIDVGYAYEIEPRGFEKGIVARDNLFAGPGIATLPQIDAGLIVKTPADIPEVAPVGLNGLAAALKLHVNPRRTSLTDEMFLHPNDFWGDPMVDQNVVGPFATSWATASH